MARDLLIAWETPAIDPCRTRSYNLRCSGNPLGRYWIAGVELFDDRGKKMAFSRLRVR
jgi:hypothetical protein